MIFDSFPTEVMLGYMFEGIKPLLPVFMGIIVIKYIDVILMAIYKSIVYHSTLFFGGSNRQANKNAKTTENIIDLTSVYNDVFKDK